LPLPTGRLPNSPSSPYTTLFRSERHPEQARAQVDLSHVHQHVLRDREAVQVASIAAQGRFRLAAAVAEVPRFAREARVGGATELGQCRERSGELSGLGHGAVLYASRDPESWYTAATRNSERPSGDPGGEKGTRDERKRRERPRREAGRLLRLSRRRT